MSCGIIKTYHKNDCDDYHCECNEINGNNIKAIYFQNNNKNEGIYTEYHFDGQLLQKNNYINGKKNGNSIYYLYIHLLKDDPEFNYGIGHNDIICGICNYIDDKLDGEYIHYDMDGSIDKVCNYKNHLRTDPYECSICITSWQKS